MKITIKNKEFNSKKMTLSNYKKYTEVRDRISEKDGYSYEDLEDMIDVLVFTFDNQFTNDDIEEDLEVDEIIYNFLRLDIEIFEKLNKKIDKTNKLFTKDKN